jgi:hypothetical protein
MGQSGLFEPRIRQNERHNKQRTLKNRVNLVKFKACSVSEEACSAGMVHPDVVRTYLKVTNRALNGEQSPHLLESLRRSAPKLENN